MKLEFGFGQGVERVEVPQANLLGVLTPNPRGSWPHRRGGSAPGAGSAHRHAPAAGHPAAGEKIAIVTSDVTRPMPTWQVMGPLLEEMEAAGVKDQGRDFGICPGSHRKHTPQEMARLAGPQAMGRIRCVDSDPADCVSLAAPAVAPRWISPGWWPRRTGAYAWATSNTTISPGIRGRQGADAWGIHALRHPGESPDDGAGGSLRRAAGRQPPAGGISRKRRPWWGSTSSQRGAGRAQAHRQGGGGRSGGRPPGRVRLPGQVLPEGDSPAGRTSYWYPQGGAPKDLNLYQTQKALDNAKHAVKEGGVVVLIGSCREGLGEKTFEQWMTSAPPPTA